MNSDARFARCLYVTPVIDIHPTLAPEMHCSCASDEYCSVHQGDSVRWLPLEEFTGQLDTLGLPRVILRGCLVAA